MEYRKHSNKHYRWGFVSFEDYQKLVDERMWALDRFIENYIKHKKLVSIEKDEEKIESIEKEEGKLVPIEKEEEKLVVSIWKEEEFKSLEKWKLELRTTNEKVVIRKYESYLEGLIHKPTLFNFEKAYLIYIKSDVLQRFDTTPTTSDLLIQEYGKSGDAIYKHYRRICTGKRSVKGSEIENILSVVLPSEDQELIDCLNKELSKLC